MWANKPQEIHIKGQRRNEYGIFRKFEKIKRQRTKKKDRPHGDRIKKKKKND